MYPTNYTYPVHPDNRRTDRKSKGFQVNRLNNTINRELNQEIKDWKNGVTD